MYCPNCKKKGTAVIDSKIIKKNYFGIKRKRICTCGYEFETYELERNKTKKRKIDTRTKWANYRFKTYIKTRFTELLYDLNNLNLGVPLISNNVEVIKENRKIKIVLTDIKKNKVIKKKVPLRPRSITLNQILTWDEYWKARYEINKYPIDDKDRPNQVKIEKREFEKSIVNHLRKNKKYNNKEYMTSCFDDKENNYAHVKNLFLYSDKFWNHWQKIL